MSDQLRRRLFDALDALTIVDPHTHIDPHAPASRTLADVLGYHYYTELAHSAGMPVADIEQPGLPPRDKVARLVERLAPLENTIQYSWLIEMARTFFDFGHDRLTTTNWGELYDRSLVAMSQPGWADTVLSRSRLSGVFLTNEFDDPLTGFDTGRYIPCLRTDDLVFRLADPAVQQRLARATGSQPTEAASLRRALAMIFERFVKAGARACAISLPPEFEPPTTAGQANPAFVSELLGRGPDCGELARTQTGRWVFWTLAELCGDFGLPFDLMIGVNRNVYPAGVHQGRDLYAANRTSLRPYAGLFCAFPTVTFPVSVLASATNQELVSYCWIFPNVVTNGHWWYSNTPSVIEADLAHRLEAAPATKQIGYYSDMYKLEFAQPKFAMYKRCLAKVLAERFVVDRGWNEDRALSLGVTVLADNTARVFPPIKPRGG